MNMIIAWFLLYIIYNYIFAPHYMRFLKYILILFLSLSNYAQNLDSLWKVYNDKKQADTNRLKAIQAIAWSYKSNKPDTFIFLAEQELRFVSKLPLSERKLWTASVFNDIGVVFIEKSNFPKALEFLLKALQLQEEIANKKGIGNCYSNIGRVYESQYNYPTALENYLKALKIRESINDEKGIGDCYGNIGNIYFYQNDYSKALDYYFQSLKTKENLGDKMGQAVCYGNIGNIYERQEKYIEALDFFLKSLKAAKEIGYKQALGLGYNNISVLYNNLVNFKLAILYGDSALQVCKEIKDIDDERLTYENLADIYAKNGRYKEAYDYHVKFKGLTDSIFNADNSKQLGDLKTQFEVEKKEAELKAKAEAQEAINAEEKKRQQFIIYAVVGVLLIVTFFSGLLYKRFILTNKQKEIIELKSKETEEQKYLVEEKQKEIIDSITYAKRLQRAILPADAEIKKYLPDSFIYYKPKDIVAGDFYWMEHLDDLTFIAAADSTGHGVPGAMVSVVCSNALNRAVKEFGLRDTGKILDKTRELVLETFEKSGEEIKDGMDISLLSISRQKNGVKTTIQWSGANNALWYISGKELTEIKADKQPIGKTDKPVPFTTHNLELTKTGGVFYLMTDGYPDQFGGTKGKKFKYKQLKEKLLANGAKILEEQKNILTLLFEEWKGNLEQVDDVTIIGIRIC